MELIIIYFYLFMYYITAVVSPYPPLKIGKTELNLLNREKTSQSDWCSITSLLYIAISFHYKCITRTVCNLTIIWRNKCLKVSTFARLLNYGTLNVDFFGWRFWIKNASVLEAWIVFLKFLVNIFLSMTRFLNVSYLIIYKVIFKQE